MDDNKGSKLPYKCTAYVYGVFTWGESAISCRHTYRRTDSRLSVTTTAAAPEGNPILCGMDSRNTVNKLVASRQPIDSFICVHFTGKLDGFWILCYT